MTRKIITATLALLMLLSLVLTGCNGANSNATTTATTAAAAGTTGATTAAAEDSKYPAYLNTETTLPIVKDGEEPITLSVAWGRNDVDKLAPLEETQFYNAFKELANVIMDVEVIDSAAAAERLNLMLNTNDLPDICLQMKDGDNISAQYGAEEGVLLEFSQYFDLIPAYMALCEDYPMALTAATELDGKVYKFPYVIFGKNSGGVRPLRIFEAAANELGLTVETLPNTLDGVEAVAREYKELHPDSYPFGWNDLFMPMDSWLTWSMGYLRDAAGYLQCTEIHTREGVPEIPANNDEIYLDMVTRMKSYYDDGLINPDYYTMSKEELLAQLAEGKSVFTTLTAWYVWNDATREQEMWVMPATRSQYKDNDYQPMYANVNNVSNGILASADTEYPEVIARFVNLMFDPEEWQFWGQMMEGSKYDLGIISNTYTFDEETGLYVQTQNVSEAMTEKGYAFATAAMMGQRPFGVMFNGAKSVGDAIGSDWRYTLAAAGFNVGDDINQKQWPEYTVWYQSRLDEVYWPNMTEGWPKFVKYTPEQSQVITDYGSVVKDYIKAETAKFVTGERPLDEYAAFQEQLSVLGIDKLQQAYTDAYNAYVALEG